MIEDKRLAKKYGLKSRKKTPAGTPKRPAKKPAVEAGTSSKPTKAKASSGLSRDENGRFVRKK